MSDPTLSPSLPEVFLWDFDAIELNRAEAVAVQDERFLRRLEGLAVAACNAGASSTEIKALFCAEVAKHFVQVVP